MWLPGVHAEQARQLHQLSQHKTSKDKAPTRINIIWFSWLQFRDVQSPELQFVLAQRLAGLGSVHKTLQFRILQGFCILANFSVIIKMVKCDLKDLNFASKDSRCGIMVSSFGEKQRLKMIRDNTFFAIS